MPEYDIELIIDTDVDLNDPKVFRDLERLIKGYSSDIEHDQLLDVEVINITRRGKVS